MLIAVRVRESVVQYAALSEPIEPGVNRRVRRFDARLHEQSAP